VATRNIEITWVNRGLVIAYVDGRAVRIGGEVLLEHDPDYMIYARSVTAWDDGTPLSGEEQAELLDEVVDEAARHGWKFEISWAVMASGTRGPDADQAPD
jgi:Immunity protein 74